MPHRTKSQQKKGFSIPLLTSPTPRTILFLSLPLEGAKKTIMESVKEEIKAMEVQIEKDPNRKCMFDVIIGDKFFLATTVIGGPDGDSVVKDWVQQVQKSHRKGKKGEVVVGISAERSRSYANAPHKRYLLSRRWFLPVRLAVFVPIVKPQALRSTFVFSQVFSCFFVSVLLFLIEIVHVSAGSKDNPYDLLQLCAGNQCLLYELDPSHPIPKILKDFIHDSRIFGVGIEAMAKELEREVGLTMRKPVELRKLAEKSKEISVGYVDFRRKNLEQLGRIVLGGEAEMARPRKMKWQIHDKYGPKPWDYDVRLSDDMIKHASIDAFLACKMGTKLLKNVD